MNVWIIFVGETLPLDKDSRQWRYGMLADALARRGHKVTRWAPTFNHSQKKQRALKNTLHRINDHYSIKLIFNKSYKKNVSFRRFLSYRQFSLGLKKAFSSTSTMPDIIVAGLPSPDACEVAVQFANKHKIPICVDIRDLWPDIFFRNFHTILQGGLQKLLKATYYDINKILKDADILFAVSQSYLDWGLAKAERTKDYSDAVFPIGYKLLAEKGDRKRNRELLKNTGVDSSKFICCYCGQLESTYDIDTIISAAKKLHLEEVDHIQFVICGRGKKEEYIKEMAGKLPNIIYLGWVSSSLIETIMEIGSIGLASYALNAPQSLPNKPFEYLAGGLPIASSLPGELANILEKHNCGFTYDAGSVEGLLRGVMTLNENPERLLGMAKNARELFSTEYSAEKIYPEMVECLERIVAQNQ